jgi:hypothetical protein
VVCFGLCRTCASSGLVTGVGVAAWLSITIDSPRLKHFVIIKNGRPYLAHYDREQQAMAETVLAVYECDMCHAQHAVGVATPNCCRIEHSEIDTSEFRRPRMAVFKDDGEDGEGS